MIGQTWELPAQPSSHSTQNIPTPHTQYLIHTCEAYRACKEPVPRRTEAFLSKDQKLSGSSGYCCSVFVIGSKSTSSYNVNKTTQVTEGRIKDQFSCL